MTTALDWTRRRNLLLTLVFVARAGDVAGVVWAMAGLLAYWGLNAIAPAVLAGSVLCLGVLWITAWARGRGVMTQWTAWFIGIMFFVMLAIRLVLPFFPMWGSMGFFIAMEVVLFCGLGANFGMTDQYLAYQERDHLADSLQTASLCGGVVGALSFLLIFADVGIEGIALVVMVIFLMQLTLTYRISYLHQVYGAAEQLKVNLHLGKATSIAFWRSLGRQLPIVALALLAGLLANYVRIQLHIWALGILNDAIIYQVKGYTLLIGVATAIVGIIGLVALFATRWFARRYGVLPAVMIFPIILLLVTLGAALNPNSLVAVACAYITYLGLLFAMMILVTRRALAVLPQRFISETHFYCYGVSGALGLVIGAAVMNLGWGILPVTAFLWSSVVVSVGLLFTLFFLGYRYRRSWLDKFRRHQWDFTELEDRTAYLPYVEPTEIELLIGSDDPWLQQLGLTLATHSTEVSHYLFAVVPLMEKEESLRLRKPIHDYLMKLPEDSLAELLNSESERVKTHVLSAAVATKLPVKMDLLSRLVRDESDWVRLLACAASWQLGLGELATVTWEAMSIGGIRDEALIDFVDVVRDDSPQEVIAVLQKLAWYPSAKVRPHAMRKMAAVLEKTGLGDQTLFDTGEKGATHEDPEVRAAAVRLLVASGNEKRGEEIAKLMGDESLLVRQAAAVGLVDLGQAGIAIATNLLDPNYGTRHHAALITLAKSGKAGEKVIKDLFADWAQLGQDMLPLHAHAEQGGGEWLPVELIMRNYPKRLVRHTAVALTASGYTHAAAGLRSLMGRGSEGALAYSAIEASAPRDLVSPVLGLLRQIDQLQQWDRPLKDDALLRTMIESENKWIIIAALHAWQALFKEVPESILSGLRGQDRWLDQTIETVTGHKPKEYFMDRLIFLGRVSFFEGLTLDELLLLDQSLLQEELLEGEVIFEEGQLGDRFYLIFEGEVGLYSGMGKSRKLLTRLKGGEYFAEMSLFDDAPRSATAVAATNCVLLSLEKEKFHQLMTEKPEILFEICKELSRRLRATDQRLAAID